MFRPEWVQASGLGPRPRASVPLMRGGPMVLHADKGFVYGGENDVSRLMSHEVCMWAGETSSLYRQSRS